MTLKSVYVAIVAFFGPVRDSIKGHVNLTELTRAILVGFAAGGTASELFAAIGQALPSIVSAEDLSLATAAFVIVAEVHRRLGHGEDAAFAPILRFPRSDRAA